MELDEARKTLAHIEYVKREMKLRWDDLTGDLFLNPQDRKDCREAITEAIANAFYDQWAEADEIVADAERKERLDHEYGVMRDMVGA